MTDPTVAETTATAVGGLTAGFMLDGQTYKAGAEAGFTGLDFYVAGRCGVLGDVDADIVSAALVFWNPDTIRTQWEASADVMSRADAATLFAACLGTWAERNIRPDALDWSRLAALAAKVAETATIGGAPLFAGWRAMPVPSDPVGAALHHMNSLRELRMARHGGAVLAVGLDPAEAVRHNSPGMAALYGWPEAELPEGTAERWAEAEMLTNRATAADYAALSAAEATEFAELAAAAVSG